MTEKKNYTISDIYMRGPSSFDSPQDTPITAGSLGLTTDARTANILKEVSDKTSTGVKQIELEFVSPEVFDSIPQQQLKEVRRLSELTGVGLSVHGPVVDTTGISQQGFSELNRESSERRIIQTIERSHELDPKGNIIVNFHSAEGIPGTEWKTLGDKREARKLIVVNRESGKLAPLEEERKFYPEMREIKKGITEEDIQKYRKGKIGADKIYDFIPPGKGKIYTPEKELKVLNDSEWINSITGIETFKKQADEVMSGAVVSLAPMLSEYKKGDKIELTPQQQSAMMQLQRGETFLSNVESSFNSIYNKAYKYGDGKIKEKLIKISENWVKEMKNLEKESNNFNVPILKSQLLEKAIAQLRDVQAPEMYIPVEEFATEQSSKTFGNAAFEAWKKFGDKAPIISIENPPAGFALSTGEDLKNLAEKSREHFVSKLKEEGMSGKQAKAQAEKLIGVTWDVGHINMLRKQGFGEEDIIKETEKIAPLIKHVHLSDNFGFEHTELPMGMGNVPTKEIMEKLGKKGFEAKKIVEAIGWWQHFQSSPLQETMEALGSPMQSTAPGLYWNQVVGLQQGYLSGYGQMLPPKHYETFGAGFAQLPQEVGGQMPGAQGSRMSGKPME